MEHYAGFRFRFDVDLARLDDPVQRCFIPSSLGPGGRAFVDRCIATPRGRVRTGLHTVLRHFLSDFDANGLLDMYPMHLLDRDGFARLLPGRVPLGLDFGAGNGDVSVALQPSVDLLHVAEQSSAMRRRLARRGFRVVDPLAAGPTSNQPSYDLIACLNVIDRTRRPRSTLRALAQRLSPTGNLLLSAPLPLAPFYYDGASTHPPEEPLPRASTWESSVSALLAWLAQTLPDFRLRRFTRTPYLSGGDSLRTLYVLDTAVFVLGREPDRADGPGSRTRASQQNR